MGEPNTSLKVTKPGRCSSFRLRKKQNEVKRQFVNNRRSDDFGDDVSDTTDDTLDPGLLVGGIRQNLRKLLRTKHRLDTESITEEDKESDWWTWGRAGGVIKTAQSHDGDPAEGEKRSLNSLDINTRYHLNN